MSKVVLIVDGSSTMRRVVERSLHLAGLEPQQILEASDGAEALHVIEQTRPDLILSDIMLDGIDGLQLLKQLREAEATRTVPLVFITSHASEAQVQEALDLGAQGYIRKPFTPDQIKDYIAPLFV
ncbi:MAG: response regulator [Terriglobales bacterium]